MIDRIFVDSNVWIYLFTGDTRKSHLAECFILEKGFISKIFIHLQPEFRHKFIIYLCLKQKENRVETTVDQIKNKIAKRKRGNLFFPDDFAQLGTPVAIRLALSKLTKSGLLKRIAHGVYYSTAKDVKIGNSVFSPMPSVDDIAQAIAKRDKARIVPTASHALNLLGLSTQVPANVVYITDGAPRRISVGKGRGILFQHTSELKKLAYKSKLLMLIVSALREIGEGKKLPKSNLK
ncbi:hypothetical protein FACS1894199_16730 [Bacteroidia bacterium]|nr:hypothetical protein FACS1894199_16730 [Bacteroidia bacterium]